MSNSYIIHSLSGYSYIIHSLSGYSPFAGDSDQETFNNINHCDYDFADDTWDNISYDGKDFISRLLVKDRR